MTNKNIHAFVGEVIEPNQSDVSPIVALQDLRRESPLRELWDERRSYYTIYSTHKIHVTFTLSYQYMI